LIRGRVEGTAALEQPERFIADDIFPADVAIAFGMTAWQRPLARALELYRAGLARRLVFTGGFNPKIGACEADEMAREARALGVPAADMIVEARSINTAENVVNSCRAIDASIGLANVRSILLVAIHFHMRRVKVLAERTFPGGIRIGTASYPSIHYSSADWSQSERGRADVASEDRKLQAYLGEHG
jgi:uncharacterized SAM-binding protein YcdF (DUF218 family)